MNSEKVIFEFLDFLVCAAVVFAGLVLAAIMVGFLVPFAVTIMVFAAIVAICLTGVFLLFSVIRRLRG